MVEAASEEAEVASLEAEARATDLTEVDSDLLPEAEESFLEVVLAIKW